MAAELIVLNRQVTGSCLLGVTASGTGLGKVFEGSPIQNAPETCPEKPGGFAPGFSGQVSGAF